MAAKGGIIAAVAATSITSAFGAAAVTRILVKALNALFKPIFNAFEDHEVLHRFDWLACRRTYYVCGVFVYLFSVARLMFGYNTMSAGVV